MGENVRVCEIAPELKEKLKQFRFRKEKDNAAIIVKVDKEKQMVVLEEEHRDCSIDEVREQLPESQPRYVVYSYEYAHEDGRKSYPLCFIFVSPEGCSPQLQMMYAGSMKSLVSEIGITKIFEVRILEDLTEDWLKEKLQYFR